MDFPRQSCLALKDDLLLLLNWERVISLATLGGVFNVVLGLGRLGVTPSTDTDVTKGIVEGCKKAQVVLAAAFDAIVFKEQELLHSGEGVGVLGEGIVNFGVIDSDTDSMIRLGAAVVFLGGYGNKRSHAALLLLLLLAGGLLLLLV